jgi:hypothetical protein
MRADLVTVCPGWAGSASARAGADVSGGPSDDRLRRSARSPAPDGYETHGDADEGHHSPSDQSAVEDDRHDDYQQKPEMNAPVSSSVIGAS